MPGTIRRFFGTGQHDYEVKPIKTKKKIKCMLLFSECIILFKKKV